MSNATLLPIPKRFSIFENFGELTIEFKWSRIVGIVVMVFAIIWNSFMVLIISKMPPEIRYFIVLHAAVGVFMVYFALCQLFNKTTITCTNDALHIKSGPLPTFNNKNILRMDITQLYFTEKITRGKNSSQQISYRLHMLDKNNRSIKLINYLPDPESARFIEHKLEKFYKIENKKVAGEYDA
ncbi:MAG TPA: hypothetical protein VD905_15245 [Flavobacteriales bacterium]|nr:hypothetical protein [Flavobacteriales bacterium]